VPAEQRFAQNIPNKNHERLESKDGLVLASSTILVRTVKHEWRGYLITLLTRRRGLTQVLEPCAAAIK
jgi:hypothetical protein